MFKMSTVGRNAHVQTFAKAVDSFVDCCLWQDPDLLHCAFSSRMVFDFDWSLWNAWSIAPHTW